MGGRVLATVATGALLIAGCGDEDFENNARAPVRIQLTGVILSVPFVEFGLGIE